MPFDKDSINIFLSDPLQLRGDEDCTYHRLKAQLCGFNDDIVAREICLANQTYQLSLAAKPWRILRKRMKTLSQAWMVFMLANMAPNGHVSDLNIPRYHLLYCLLKDNHFVDVTKIICYEIYKFARFKIGQNNQKAKGTLGFPALITALCSPWCGG